MHIKLGNFLEIDRRYGVYIRVAGLGAAHRHPRLGWTFDTWAAIRRVERARPAIAG